MHTIPSHTLNCVFNTEKSYAMDSVLDIELWAGDVRLPRRLMSLLLNPV